ncbi:MAG: MTAP family purine nucleoside phosphorylase [Methanolinea sp.]|nr:MTAP family purine nucleoside phosphorylase [Methanolinea sp.]
MLGIIGGTSLLFANLPPLEKRVVHTPYGNSEVLAGEIAILLRHQRSTPPHRINYRAHLSALALLGVDRLIGVGSSGSLTRAIPPGSLVIPTDYYSTATIPSIHDHAICHVHPGFSPGLSNQLKERIPEALFGGTYIQTRGPRIETVAEVRNLALAGDIVGMTLASEATLAVELGMEMAALCTIDNYANGLSDELLTYEHIVESAARYKDRTEEIISRIIRGLS